MKLLNVPETFPFKEEKVFENFGLFDLAFTERNWRGNQYVPKETCIPFLMELEELNPIFRNVLNNVDIPIKLKFILDTSIFSNELPFNNKLIEFLEELDDFSEANIHIMNAEKEKKMNKYMKKLRGYGNNPQNFPYLFRWAFENTQHPFHNDIIDFLENSVSNDRKRLMKSAFEKALKEIMKEKGLKCACEDCIDDKEEFESSIGSLSLIYTQKIDKEFIDKIFKYTMDEPTLIYYAVYILSIYFNAVPPKISNEFDVPLEEPCKLIHIARDKQKLTIKTMYLDSEDSQKALNHEDFLNENIFNVVFFTKGDESSKSLREIKDGAFALDSQKIEVLKTIVDWVSNRIPDDLNINSLPTKPWIHFIKGDLFENLDFTTMSLTNMDVIGGAEENELLLHVVTTTENFQDAYRFPLLDTKHWDKLNGRQCAIMAYAACLFHDVCIENNYHLEHFDEVISELVTNEKKSKTSPLKLNEKNAQNSQNEKTKKEYRKKEHWVSFHFRRLNDPKKGPSPEAVSKAKSFGINKIPYGFTFVSPHSRGEKTENMRLSAIDILLKTLSKLENYNEIKEKMTS